VFDVAERVLQAAIPVRQNEDGRHYVEQLDRLRLQPKHLRKTNDRIPAFVG